MVNPCPVPGVVILVAKHGPMYVAFETPSPMSQTLMNNLTLFSANPATSNSTDPMTGEEMKKWLRLNRRPLFQNLGLQALTDAGAAESPRRFELIESPKEIIECFWDWWRLITVLFLKGQSIEMSSVKSMHLLCV